MSTLQESFLQHEKIKQFITKLDMKKGKNEISVEQYNERKKYYEELLNTALMNIKGIRAKLKEERDRTQNNLITLDKETKNIELRSKNGELSPEQTKKLLQMIRSKTERCQQYIRYLGLQLAARSSQDLVGYVTVDVNEHNQPECNLKKDSQNNQQKNTDVHDKTNMVVNNKNIEQPLIHTCEISPEQTLPIKKKNSKKLILIIFVFGGVFLCVLGARISLEFASFLRGTGMLFGAAVFCFFLVYLFYKLGVSPEWASTLLTGRDSGFNLINNIYRLFNKIEAIQRKKKLKKQGSEVTKP